MFFRFWCKKRETCLKNEKEILFFPPLSSAALCIRIASCVFRYLSLDEGPKRERERERNRERETERQRDREREREEQEEENRHSDSLQQAVGKKKTRLARFFVLFLQKKQKKN